MYDRLTIEVALGTLASGGTVRQAARAAGVGRSTVNDWAHGRLPSGTGGALDAAERAAYEAAMTENMLLRAVLDDLKAAGSHPLSISNRRKCELGERLREATGLPLREVTAFLRISRSSYEYHRARLGADKYAGLRAEVRALFAEMGGGRGYRPVWAELRRRGTRVSEKVVRRIMREEGLSASRRRRRRWSSYAGEASPAPPNLPLRADGTHDFSAPAPNELWVTDITEFRLPSGERAYLSPVLESISISPIRRIGHSQVHQRIFASHANASAPISAPRASARHRLLPLVLRDQPETQHRAGVAGQVRRRQEREELHRQRRVLRELQARDGAVRGDAAPARQRHRHAHPDLGVVPEALEGPPQRPSVHHALPSGASPPPLSSGRSLVL